MRPLVLLFMACPGPGPMDKGTPVDSEPEQSFDTDTGDSTHEDDTDDSADTDTDTDTDTDDTDDCRRTSWYADADSDGKGDPESHTRACEQPVGTVSNSGDCDDTRADIYTGAPEICDDEIINDCNDEHGEDAWALCVTTETFSLAMADAKIIGEDSGDVAGAWVDAAGDVNGDGRMDLLIGAQYRDAGSLYVVLGPVSGTVDLSTAIGEIQGESMDTPAHGDIASAGDMNGDGFLDVVIGAPYPGRDGAYLVFGPISGTQNLSSADTLWAWPEEERYSRGDDQVGISVVGVGDTNEDGYDDVLIGAPYTDTDGEESELGGCPAEEESTDEGPEHNETTGAAYLLFGPTSGAHLLSDADATLIGEDGNDYAGYSVANPGDMDGDGVVDLLVGAPQNCEGGSRAGAAYLLYAPVTGEHDLEDADIKYIAARTEDNAAMEVNGAGDVNGDGHPDVLIGASDPESSEGREGRGMVYLVNGPNLEDMSLRDADATVVGEAMTDHLGESASPAGDINLDGHDDVLVGAPYQDASGEESGAAYLVYGPISGTHPLSVSVKLNGPNAGDFAGLQATGVGDTNADGYPDLLIGAPGDDEGGTSAGAAYVVLGGGAILSSLGSW